ncbi:MAG TPA: flagellar export chaperone FliS [Bryobacteraceae bacterium]|nr:flagellar export chaperone FliS [Bryobacteraceae bacterium]
MQPQNAYLESQIQTASPLELVCVLYRAAGDATRIAGAHLAAGRIPERSRQISKALAILTQLSGTLDHAKGGALSRGLAELYDYMQRRLLEANQRRQAEPLVEVGNLLATLLEGWERIRATPEQVLSVVEPAAPKASRYAPVSADRSAEYGGYPAVFAAAAPEYTTQSWSF